jgi:HK97 family phage major capsid protein
VTKSLLRQTSGAVEELVRSDFQSALASAIENVAIEGGGTGEPEGIIDTIDALEEDVDLDWAGVLAMWAEVAGSNADQGSLAFLTNPSLAADMMATAKVDGWTASPFIMNETTRQVMGYPSGITSNVPTGVAGSDDRALIFGNMNDLVIGMFGAAEIGVDPYTLMHSGQTRIVVEYFVDVALRREYSFTYSTFGA